MNNIPKMHQSELVWNLLLSAKIALGADGSTTSPTDRQRLLNAVIAIEEGIHNKTFDLRFDDANIRYKMRLIPVISIHHWADLNGKSDVSMYGNVEYEDRADVDITFLSSISIEVVINKLRTSANWLEQNTRAALSKIPTLNEDQLAHNEFVKEINDDHL